MNDKGFILSMHVNLTFIYFKQVFSENMAEKDLVAVATRSFLSVSMFLILQRRLTKFTFKDSNES